MHQDKITEIFVEVDDFCIKFKKQIAESRKISSSGTKSTRNRASKLADSEIITIMIGFHLEAHKCFKHYYIQIVEPYYKNLFPELVSYNRFVELQSKVTVRWYNKSLQFFDWFVSQNDQFNYLKTDGFLMICLKKKLNYWAAERHLARPTPCTCLMKRMH